MLLAVVACSSTNNKKAEVSHKVNVEEDHSYGKAWSIGHVKNKEIDEASGLVVSRDHPNLLWTHNDSWDEARIFSIKKNGHLQAEYHLEGATNRDWEDITAGPGPQSGDSYLYIGDIGDNFTLYSSYVIYRLKQPAPVSDSTKIPLRESLTGVEKLRFVYPDGSHDAETLFIDPSTRDLYIVTKQEKKDRVYRYPYPQSTTKIDTAEFVCELPFNQFTGGDLSSDGQNLLLKTLQRVFIWRREPDQSISDMLSKKPKEVLPYETGPQEEAIAFGLNGTGYYTLSESHGKPVSLYFHKAKSKKKRK